MCTDRCPVWFIIDRSDAPAIAAEVACPLRREWPLYFAVSSAKALTDSGSPSVSIAVVQGGKIAYEKAYGRARLEPATDAKVKSFAAYYHGSRTHLSLAKDSPEPRARQNSDASWISRK
jgi:hypothetical protein